MTHYQFQPLGESAILLEYGNEIDAAIHDKILWDWGKLKSLGSELFKDLIPAYTTLTVIYDLQKLHRLKGDGDLYSKMCRIVSEALAEGPTPFTPTPRALKVPVCYDVMYAPDIEWAAMQKGLTIDELIDLHTASDYRVYMLGFLPGFAYMGEVDEKIALPRKNEPRLKVPAGSVGIAGRQTGIYPTESPGGWQLIGRTPIKLFDPEASDPAFFQPGDTVRFYSISRDEFENY